MANAMADELDQYFERVSDEVGQVRDALEAIDIYAAGAEEAMQDAINRLEKIRDNLY